MTNTDLSPTDWPVDIPLEQQYIRASIRENPLTKARVHRNRMNEDYAILMRDMLAGVCSGREPDALSAFGMRCVFYRADRQRVDCDNLLKVVSDIATGIVWKDDTQVVELMGRVFVDSDWPRTELAIYRVPGESRRRPGACERCGSPVRFAFRSRTTRYCSTACFQADCYVDCVCPWCQKPFRLRKSSLRGGRKPCCSRECGWAKRAADVRRDGSDKWRCHTCGDRVSRKEYTRCRACFAKSRGDLKSNYWTGRLFD